MKKQVTVTVSITGQKVFRDNNGKFTTVKQVDRKNSPIRNGSLYDYRGTTVRAREQYAGGKTLVSVHDTLHGLVKEKELMPISKRKVKNYLNA